jgi:hypothetical protein
MKTLEPALVQPQRPLIELSWSLTFTTSYHRHAVVSELCEWNVQVD